MYESPATATATGSPTYRTSPWASTGCGGVRSVGLAAAQGTEPTLSPMSAPVTTVTTPGSAWAASVLMPLMRAWAWGLRRMAACITSAMRRSST